MKRGERTNAKQRSNVQQPLTINDVASKEYAADFVSEDVFISWSMESLDTQFFFFIFGSLFLSFFVRTNGNSCMYETKNKRS